MQDVELVSGIMLSLEEMFGEQGRSARQETMRQSKSIISKWLKAVQ